MPPVSPDPRALPPPVWVGQCLCGALVYERDGRRYLLETRQEHTPAACQARRAQESSR